jgi:putative ABC transport system ATP-binding protein
MSPAGQWRRDRRPACYNSCPVTRTTSVVLQLQQVRKVYGRSSKPASAARRPALDGVTLTVAAGELVALLGPSGSGKTTLVNLAAGLDRPTEGAVTVTGQPLADLNEAARARFRRQRIGVVSLAIHLLPSLTIEDNVLLPARLANVDRRAAAARAAELLERLGIADVARRLPDELSGGEQQRAAIARALVNRPSLLLADEPTGALDRAGGAEVLHLIDQVSTGDRARPAVLLATHDADLATAWSQRVVRLLDGRVVADIQLPPALNGKNGREAAATNGLRELAVLAAPTAPRADEVHAAASSPGTSSPPGSAAPLRS